MKSRLFILFLLCSSSVYCQTSDISRNFWVSGGTGIYKDGLYTGFPLYISLNGSQSKLSDKINHRKRYKATKLEFRLINNTSSLSEDNYENLNEFALLCGISFGKALQFSVSGGIGLIKGIKTAGINPPGTPVYFDEKVFTPGLPLELNLSLRPVRFFGLGLTGFANLNFKAPIYGCILNVELGKLHSKNQNPNR
jgi:hypothetical protein